MRARIYPLVTLSIAMVFALGVGECQQGSETQIPGLQNEVRVITDEFGVRHLEAEDDRDLFIASGYLHCLDRLFQMDQTRRQVDGTEAELLGPGELGSDIQARVVGLGRAAQRSLDEAPPEFAELLQAYADGVNACIEQEPLPPEYALLELTQVRPWTAVDALKIGKAIAANLSLDIDTGLTETFAAYVQAGDDNGFDGAALFSEDVFRSAPMDPAATVPDATNEFPFLQASNAKPDTEYLAWAREASRKVSEKLKEHPIFSLAMNRRDHFVGSNEWGVTGSATPDGRPIIANDPHLSLNIPSTFYEWHLVVKDDPVRGPLNVNGIGFPGAPGVILGQTEHVTWGATTNPMDVSDVFADELQVGTPACVMAGGLACINSGGVLYPVTLQLGVQYFFNQIGDNIDDNLVEATNLPTEATIIGTVDFRSFGPILGIDDPSVLTPPFGTTTALVLQYTGLHGTQELQTFQIWNRAKDLDDFKDGLDKFDVGSQNWAYADTDGNLGYFASAENPLRADLESGNPDDTPPFFVQDGVSGVNNWIPDPDRLQGQTIPYAILPADEMPQTLNPANDYFVNANNDPAGTTLDNDPLNQRRIGNPNAIYYLNPGYAIGMRAGRIDRLIRGKLDAGEKVSFEDMKRFQANTQQLDAEILRPFLLEAFSNASAQGADPALAALAADPGIAEAIGRLALWDFSTPTGIAEGYDQSDVNGVRLPTTPCGVPPTGGGSDDDDDGGNDDDDGEDDDDDDGLSREQRERAASIAATIWNLWRGQAIRNVIDARLADFGLGAGSSEALKSLTNLLRADPYTGVGASGVDFIPEPAALSAEERRDLALLQALRDALDLAASDEFAPAFGNSTNQEDYCWGFLHRITFDHPFEDAFNIPPQSGFEDLSPELSGLSRDGGYNVVNASGFSARADSLNGFKFGGGPVRRYVGRSLRFRRGLFGVNVVPGGPSGIPGDPEYATQLPIWLTADYHGVNMTLLIPGGVEDTFVPAP